MTTSPSPHRCSQRIFTGARWDFGGHMCTKPAKHQSPDGKWWCSIHDPERRAARDKARREEAERAADARRRAADRATGIAARIADRVGTDIGLWHDFRSFPAVLWGYTIPLSAGDNIADLLDRQAAIIDAARAAVHAYRAARDNPSIAYEDDIEHLATLLGID